jgi:hypothetical protein
MLSLRRRLRITQSRPGPSASLQPQLRCRHTHTRQLLPYRAKLPSECDKQAHCRVDRQLLGLERQMIMRLVLFGSLRRHRPLPPRSKELESVQNVPRRHLIVSPLRRLQRELFRPVRHEAPLTTQAVDHPRRQKRSPAYRLRRSWLTLQTSHLPSQVRADRRDRVGMVPRKFWDSGDHLLSSKAT